MRFDSVAGKGMSFIPEELVNNRLAPCLISCRIVLTPCQIFFGKENHPLMVHALPADNWFFICCAYSCLVGEYSDHVSFGQADFPHALHIKDQTDLAVAHDGAARHPADIAQLADIARQTLDHRLLLAHDLVDKQA